MHILHVFPSFQLGGSQRRFAALANHFGDQYRHTIMSLDGQSEAVHLLASRVLHRELPHQRTTSLAATLMRARRIIRAESPDLLITYNWGAMEWAAANLTCLTRHIHIEDGFGPEEAHAQLLRRVLFRRAVLNINSTVVLPSRTLVKMATQSWRIAAKRIIYLPNGIPCARFQRSSASESTVDFRGEGPVIGTVAALRKEKALDRMIHAFCELRRVQPARLVIVGSGPERDALEDLVVSRNLTNSVTFTGALNHPEHVIAAFDIFAASSDTEQMPLSILEAMAAGLSIASTDVGDIRSMVAEENQPFIVAKDASALASAMLLLLRNEPLHRQIGKANQARAIQNFDEQKMFSRYRQLFSNQA